MTYCDKYFPGDVPEFFFDRNWVGFNSILDVYRSGTLHLVIIHICNNVLMFLLQLMRGRRLSADLRALNRPFLERQIIFNVQKYELAIKYYAYLTVLNLTKGLKQFGNLTF